MTTSSSRSERMGVGAYTLGSRDADTEQAPSAKRTVNRTEVVKRFDVRCIRLLQFARRKLNALAQELRAQRIPFECMVAMVSDDPASTKVTKRKVSVAITTRTTAIEALSDYEETDGARKELCSELDPDCMHLIIKCTEVGTVQIGKFWPLGRAQ